MESSIALGTLRKRILRYKTHSNTLIFNSVITLILLLGVEDCSRKSEK